MTTTFKISAVGILSFILSYVLNPLNDIMRESLAGPLQLYIKVGPSVLIVAGRFVLLALIVGSPIFFVGPLCGRHPFLEAGSFFGVLSSAASILNYIVFQKSELEVYAWFIIVPFFALLYFIVGFASGGFWGFLGKRYSPRLGYRTS